MPGRINAKNELVGEGTRRTAGSRSTLSLGHLPTERVNLFQSLLSTGEISGPAVFKYIGSRKNKY